MSRSTRSTATCPCCKELVEKTNEKGLPMREALLVLDAFWCGLLNGWLAFAGLIEAGDPRLDRCRVRMRLHN
jgi:hypothetical protein